MESEPLKMISAAHWAFGIAEVLEMILSLLQHGVKAKPNTQLVVMQRVSKDFQAIIQTPLVLRRHMWLECSEGPLERVHRMQPIIWLGQLGLTTRTYNASHAGKVILGQVSIGMKLLGRKDYHTFPVNVASDHL